MANMLRALMDRLDKIQEQIGNTTKDMETLRKKRAKQMLDIKKYYNRNK